MISAKDNDTPLNITLYLDEEAQEAYDLNQLYLNNNENYYQVKFQGKVYVLLQKHLMISDYLKELIENSQSRNIPYEVALKYGTDPEAFDLNMKLIYGMTNIRIPKKFLVQVYIIFDELKINYQKIVFLSKTAHKKLRDAIMSGINQDSVVEVLEMAINLNDKELKSSCESKLKSIDYTRLKRDGLLAKASEEAFKIIMTTHRVLLEEATKGVEHAAKLLNSQEILETISDHCNCKYSASEMAATKESKSFDFEDSFLVLSKSDESSLNPAIVNYLHKKVQKTSDGMALIQESLDKMMSKIESKFDAISSQINGLVAKVEKCEATVNEVWKEQESFKRTELFLFSRITSITEQGVVYESSHSGTIYKIIMIDNETKYATCSQDKTINIFDAKTNQLIKRLQSHADEVVDIILLSNGNLASCSQDKLIKIWDVNEGKCIQNLQGHTNWVECIIEIKNSIILSGAIDKSLRIWDLSTQDPICQALLVLQNTNQKEVRLRSGCIIDENSFAIGSDHTINIFNIEFLPTIKVKFVRKLTGHTNWVFNLGVLKKSGTLISTSDDKTCKAWNISTGQCLHTFVGHSGSVLGLVILSDSIFATSSKEIKFWNIESKLCLKTIQQSEERIWNLYISQDLKLSSCGEDKKIRFYKL